MKWETNRDTVWLSRVGKELSLDKVLVDNTRTNPSIRNRSPFILKSFSVFLCPHELRHSLLLLWQTIILCLLVTKFIKSNFFFVKFVTETVTDEVWNRRSRLYIRIIKQYIEFQQYSQVTLICSVINISLIVSRTTYRIQVIYTRKEWT